MLDNNVNGVQHAMRTLEDAWKARRQFRPIEPVSSGEEILSSSRP